MSNPLATPSRRVTGFRVAYLAAALLLAAGLQGQMLLAGLAIFDEASYWQTHAVMGAASGGLVLGMLVSAVLGRLPGWLAASTVVLALLFGLLYGIFHLALVFHLPWLRAFHPLIGAVMLLIDAGLAAVVAPDVIRRVRA